MCEGLEVVVSVDVGAFLHGNLTENLERYKKNSSKYSREVSLLLDILRSMSSCSTCVKVLSGGTGRVYKQRRAEGIRKRRMLEIQPYQITLDMSVFSTQTTVKHLHKSLT